MQRWVRIGLLACLVLTEVSCRTAAAAPAPTPSARQGGAPTGGNRARSEGPKPYDEVITDSAETSSGLFITHRLGDKLFFEIPAAELNKEILLLPRRVEHSRA
ncbi:MAG: DUF5118 domain-containing protein, partial [Gemmatimonadota bacterium]|nr:DUF5118 domain-containing protein [Gemmatimonadota bacterium]